MKERVRTSKELVKMFILAKEILPYCPYYLRIIRDGPWPVGRSLPQGP